MQNEEKETREPIWLTEALWRDQRLIAAELRRQREAAGMTREQLVEKMGEPYTVETISQYEDGRDTIMDMWTVVDMVQALNISMNDIAPKALLAKQCAESGYADLNEEARQFVNDVIQAALKRQRQNP